MSVFTPDSQEVAERSSQPKSAEKKKPTKAAPAKKKVEKKKAKKSDEKTADEKTTTAEEAKETTAASDDEMDEGAVGKNPFFQWRRSVRRCVRRPGGFYCRGKSMRKLEKCSNGRWTVCCGVRGENWKSGENERKEEKKVQI